MERKFHPNYSPSQTTTQRYRCKDGCNPNNQQQQRQDKTRQEKVRQLTCFQRYSGDTLSGKKK